ncbi:hypothetical protein [Gelidibacter gilvus]|uniref:Uncharacterized protein n=1 Tax=Gelidibacter gilvus TaxID=59602 RepID=A0A4Q0XIR4_9FLAO|nr:hypothetical protein [Gelidibacter gilvus]RXJ51091.1 hypothetical protein ESZ48_04230 [Gelidibacter gilvus]
MGIPHKFLNTDFGNGFNTNNAILTSTPYQPEILFIGTFNPLTNGDANPADFFYGRNWFWPILFNIFEHNREVIIQSQRKYCPPHFNPTLLDIFKFMKTHKITFADLIMKVFPETELDNIDGNIITYDNETYNLINDNHLIQLNQFNEVMWSTKYLIKYIEANPTIKQVYFTRKTVNPFTAELIQVQNALNQRGVTIKYLFTPSGQGLAGIPRNQELMDQWLESTRDGFDNLDEEWTNID